MGHRRRHLQAAVDALPRAAVRVLASSSTYDTDPVGEVLDQRPFLNACLRIETALTPEALLDACKAVERARGRQTDPADPGYVRHGPRPIDVDLLLLGDTAYRSERLALPHPEVTSRRCSTRSRDLSASSGEPTVPATVRARSTSTSCCWARSSCATSACRCRTRSF